MQNHGMPLGNSIPVKIDIIKTTVRLVRDRPKDHLCLDMAEKTTLADRALLLYHPGGCKASPGTTCTTALKFL